MSLFLKKYKIQFIFSIAALSVISLYFFFFKEPTESKSYPLPPIYLPQLFTNEVVNSTERTNPFAFSSDESTKTPAENRIYVIHFWASWCAPCTEEFPTILNAADQISESVIFITINLDEDINAARQFLEKLNYQKKNIIYLWDKDQSVSKQYGTIKLPESYIVDFNRHLIRKIAGSTNWENSKNIEYFKNLKK